MSEDKHISDETSEEVLIRVLGLDDKESLNSLAKLIGQDTGRQLLDVLVNSEKGMYKGELTKKMPVTYSVTSYHLSNAEKLGLIEKSERKIHKKGIKHTHNKIPKQFLIIPIGFDKEELKKQSSWKKLLRGGMKFTVLGFVSFATYAFTRKKDGSSEFSYLFNGELPDLSEIDPIFYPMLVIILGLLVVYFWKNKSKW